MADFDVLLANRGEERFFSEHWRRKPLNVRELGSKPLDKLVGSEELRPWPMILRGLPPSLDNETAIVLSWRNTSTGLVRGSEA
jgi:hypothetical protein